MIVTLFLKRLLFVGSLWWVRVREQKKQEARSLAPIFENWLYGEVWFRSSWWRCSIKKDVLKNFAKFIGKQLCQSLFLNKVVGFRLWHRCIPVNFVRFLRTALLQNTSRWLLLMILNFSVRLASFEKRNQLFHVFSTMLYDTFDEMPFFFFSTWYCSSLFFLGINLSTVFVRKGNQKYHRKYLKALCFFYNNH